MLGVEQPLDMTLCRNDLPGVVRKMVGDEEDRAGPLRRIKATLSIHLTSM
jgi:hypothetical protein